MKLLKIIVMFLNLVRGVWKKKNDLKHCKWNFQIDTGFQIRYFIHLIACLISAKRPRLSQYIYN